MTVKPTSHYSVSGTIKDILTPKILGYTKLLSRERHPLSQPQFETHSTSSTGASLERTAPEQGPEPTTPAISIIIPVYNVADWLPRAVASLQVQTFTNWELFLVDDGSPDNSGAICDSLAALDANESPTGTSRITVIHQANAGAAAARNVALRQARGEFVYFMDGDDWCEPDMLEHLYQRATTHDLDLVVSGFYIDTFYGDESEDYYEELRTAPDVVYESADDFRVHAHELFDAQLLYAPWNKLYRRSYLIDNGIEFPETFWDDLPFNLDVLRDIDRIGCLPERHYHFLRARADAENTKYRPDMYDKREEEHTWLRNLYTYWFYDEWDPDTVAAVDEFLSRRYAERLVGCIENITNASCTLSSAEKRTSIKDMISTPHAQAALALAHPHSTYMRVMLAPLKGGNVTLSMMEGSVISWVRSHNTNLFARLKANR